MASSDTGLQCYVPNMVVTSGVWLGDNPLSYSLPLFLAQILIVSLTTRAIAALLRPLHQARVVAELLAGLLLGRTCLSRILDGYMERLFFPIRSINLLDSVANMGLLFFVFIVGLEMDVSILRLTDRKVMSITIAAFIVPFIVAVSIALYFRRHFVEPTSKESVLDPTGDKVFYIYFGITFTKYSFPIVARILAEVKLLSTEVGRIALSSALLNEIICWVLVTITISITGKSVPGLPYAPAHFILLASVVFTLFCFFAVRPAFGRFLGRIPEGEAMSDWDSGTILVGVMVAGFFAEAIGINPWMAAFVYGLVIPMGTHGSALVERVEDFVNDLLLPLFFCMSAFRVELHGFQNLNTLLIFCFISITGAAAKVGATVLAAVFCGLPLSDATSIGFLGCTRGLIELILITVTRPKGIKPQAYKAFYITNVLILITLRPVVMAAYKRSRRHVGYKRRNLQHSRPDSELRMVACVHSGRNVPSIISLLDLSHPTKRSPVFVYALHLVELTGRASAMLLVHNDRRRAPQPSLPHAHVQSDRIIAAFETYEQHTGGISIQPLTCISPFSTMHEDVCAIAEERHAALIILPFHMLPTVDGRMETAHPSIRTFNASVFELAPCSVGILVDRGICSVVADACRLQHVRRIAVLFFGGPDDREALAYVYRMAEHPAVGLTVVRFIAGRDGEKGKQDSADDECVSEFRLKSTSKENVAYVERDVSNSEETVAAIRAMEEERHDLYVVGRGRGRETCLTSGLVEWSDFPELGPIGDMLASSDFGSVMSSSVLVVQQYVGENCGDVAAVDPVHTECPSATQGVQQYLSNHAAKRGAGGASGMGWNGAVCV